MKTGIEIIAEERLRQIEKENYTPEHDNIHDGGELVMASAAYIIKGFNKSKEYVPWIWPWTEEYWKPCPKDRIKELSKAGALIAAEIDRLQRMSKYKNNI